jgi:ubiquinone/menaquinone biosynthesis C-methylase UbiE
MLYQSRCKEFQPIVYFVQADAMAIPLSDNCIDLAICNNVFPHFNDKAKALKEIARVMKNDGRLAICHTMSREAVNQLHQSIGGMVAGHMLPDKFWLTKLMGHASLEINHLEDSPKHYLAIAHKKTECQDRYIQYRIL